MNTKLTLNINKDIIDQAKKYAQVKNQSISALVQNYLSFLSENQSDEIHISQEIKELSGVIKLDDNFNLKEEYRNHIMEKYS